MSATNETVQTYWDEMARFYWLTGAPLRPSEEDILHLEQLIARLTPIPSYGPIRALMLGVTPGHASMQWPDNCEVLAVDGCWPMVKGVWPGGMPRTRNAICGDWLSLPVADGCFSAVTGDGSGNCLPFPDGLRKLAGEVSRTLRPDGCFLLRCYVQQEERENPHDLVARLRAGEIESFHHFKFRLLMAMQESAAKGVALSDVHRFWIQHGIDPQRLAQATGWDVDAIRAIDAYRDSPTVHVFPASSDFRAVLGEYFEELSCTSASYPLAERCPVLSLRPRNGAGSSGRGM